MNENEGFRCRVSGVSVQVSGRLGVSGIRPATSSVESKWDPSGGTMPRLKMRPPAHRGLRLRPGGNAERKKITDDRGQITETFDSGFGISD